MSFRSAERSSNSYFDPVSVTFSDQLHFAAPDVHTHDEHFQYHDLRMCLVPGPLFHLRLPIYKRKSRKNITVAKNTMR